MQHKVNKELNVTLNLTKEECELIDKYKKAFKVDILTHEHWGEKSQRLMLTHVILTHGILKKLKPRENRIKLLISSFQSVAYLKDHKNISVDCRQKK